MGKRYISEQANLVEEHDNDKRDRYFHGDETHLTQARNLNQGVINHSTALAKSDALLMSTLQQSDEELGPSLLLNLYSDGFNVEHYIKEFLVDILPVKLIPYNSPNVSILTDIEYGQIPTGFPLNEKQCKYVNGTTLCEVRDYRVFVEFPVVHKVPLKMTMVNITSDMSPTTQNFCCKDKPESESCFLKHLHPRLNLEPTSELDFGMENKPAIKLVDQDIIRKKRKLDMSTSLYPLDRFRKIRMVTQIRFMYDVPQRTWIEDPSYATPFNFPDLVGAHLREEGLYYESNKGLPNPFFAPADHQSIATTWQNSFTQLLSSTNIPGTSSNTNSSIQQPIVTQRVDQQRVFEGDVDDLVGQWICEPATDRL